MTEKELLVNLLESIESSRSSLKAAEKWAQKLSEKMGIPASKVEQMAQEKNYDHYPENDEARVIEGVFDGQNMIDSNGSTYPVPANYASKSKLVQGDRLKLNIADNGAFIYKQIELVPRNLVVGNLVLEGSQYQVLADKRVYNVLYASVTFYRAQVGDQVTIIVPEDGQSKYAAIENVIPQHSAEAVA
jgi:hypothetical protein